MSENVYSRRDVLNLMGWLGTLGTLGGLGAICGRYMLPNVLYEPPRTYKIGKTEDYPDGLSYLPDRRIFVVRREDRIAVVSAICTHIGCTTYWVEERRRWECPCHGAVFNEQGIPVTGPAPRPLPWYGVVLSSDGRLVVDERHIALFEQRPTVEI